jgi:lysozyme family protein
MIQPTDKIWKEYARYVLGWEGKGGSDPTDTASQYVKPGQIHTMRGIIWPTFQANAKAIGVQPTYENFLKLTEAQADKILYQFYLFVQGDKMPDKIGLSITEITWGSGYGNSAPALRKAIRTFPGFSYINRTGPINADVLKAVNKIDPKALYEVIWKQRAEFLRAIVAYNPSQIKFLQGWLNRIANFQKRFPAPPKGAAISIGVIIGAIGLFFLIRTYANK